jgi:hypothetical protein
MGHHDGTPRTLRPHQQQGGRPYSATIFFIFIHFICASTTGGVINADGVSSRARALAAPAAQAEPQRNVDAARRRTRQRRIGGVFVLASVREPGGLGQRATADRQRQRAALGLVGGWSATDRQQCPGQAAKGAPPALDPD